MNTRYYLLSIFIALHFSMECYAQSVSIKDARYARYIDLHDYMKPFWKSSVVTDETVMVIREGSKITANLLFPAREILAVTSTDHRKTYLENKDWALKDGKLEILNGSTMPFFNATDLLFNIQKPNWSMGAKKPGHYILFKEGLYFQSNQLSVSYRKKSSSSWQGPRTFVRRNKLSRTKKLLNSGQELKVCFYGNSIETGYNSSGFIGGPPYMPGWPELVCWKLQEFFKSNIKYFNPSVAGKTAKWGAEQASRLVSEEKPDLVIIGFGMNDGASGVNADTFKRQISQIIETVRAGNPLAEFIVIAPMLANPLAVQDGLQNQYLEPLNQLSSADVEVVNMTGVHEELLRHKSYQDMTGNNVNHPNDYLSRWYAQMICGIFIK